MDLEDRGLKCLARRFVSQYLELTGDYQGLELLNFYKAYRALVRAKVALFSMPSEATPVERATTLRQYRNYANLAESYSTIPSRFLAITTVFRPPAKAMWQCAWSTRSVRYTPALRCRTQALVWRAASENTPQAGSMPRMPAQRPTPACIPSPKPCCARASRWSWTPPTSSVNNATPPPKSQRPLARPFLILDCNAPQAVIANWLAKRQADKNDPSDATLEVIEQQQASRDPLSAEELLLSKRVETNESGTLDALVAHVRQRLPGCKKYFLVTVKQLTAHSQQ
jgi:uncharacterized protein